MCGVSEKEAFYKYARSNEKVVVDYVKLERSFYGEHIIDTSAQAIAKWREDNSAEVDESWDSRKDTYLPECREARHILVRVDETNPDLEAAKKDATDKAAAAKKRIEAGRVVRGRRQGGERRRQHQERRRQARMLRGG